MSEGLEDGSIDFDLDVRLAWSSISPPAFPLPHQYQSCYCEENVYLLIQKLSLTLAQRNTSATDDDGLAFTWDVHAVFITNESKTTLLFQQRSSKAPEAGSPVVWDYHVVAAVSCTDAQGRCAIWIFDSDSLLATAFDPSPQPVDFVEYIEATLNLAGIRAGTMPRQYWAMFRVVPANDLLAHFASDRSHMRSANCETGELEWHAPPPTWPTIKGAGDVSTNLMTCYVDLSSASTEARYGVVYDHETFLLLNWARASPGSTLVPLTAEPKPQLSKGGRVSSPLFPAYLHAAQQDRAHTSHQDSAQHILQ